MKFFKKIIPTALFLLIAFSMGYAGTVSNPVTPATNSAPGYATAAQITKLEGIETSADVTDVTNVTAAGALMDSEIDTDLKTFALPASTTISAFGATLVDDADAGTARTTLGAIANIVEDTTPQLGGDLDGQGNIIYNVTIANFYGVSWDESADTYTRTGNLAGQAVSQTLSDALIPIQASIRRCILSDTGAIQYYLGATDSYNREGMTPSITGTDDAGVVSKVSQAVAATGTDDVGTAYKVSDVGVFTAAASEYIDKYVHNTTDDTYARITAKDSDDVLSITASIMAVGETFNIGVLSQPATNYVGHYVHNTTDDTYAMITAKDTDAALSIDADILASGEAYEICTAVLDGTDGQVMVQIPKFYYKYGYSGTTHTYEISFIPQAGFSVHPAFIKNGVVVDYRYIGAYEGIGYDASVADYIDNTNVAATGWSGTTIDIANDILSSVSGKNPVTDETRAEFRAIAANRGTGWRQLDYDLASAVQLLYLIEYADWNSQSMIGAGRTQLTGGTWVKDSYIGVTGKSNGDGNGTNSVAGDTNDAYMTYRGIENVFGNIWKWVDGINVNENRSYVTNTDTNFADDTTTNYTDLGISLIATNGYAVTLEQQARGFLPASVGGSSSTYLTDYYYQSTGWRVVRLGGGAGSGAYAGVACWRASYASSSDDADVGGRTTY